VAFSAALVDALGADITTWAAFGMPLSTSGRNFTDHSVK
jgi:hypothetical protein